jgi:hypothetical protein
VPAATGGKKIAGLKPKAAIVVGLAVFVVVFLWYRNRSKNQGIPTQTQTTPQVGPDTGSAAPPTQPVQDSTGGVTQPSSLTDLLGTISGFLGSLPYTSYTYSPTTTGSYNTTSTTTNYNGYGAGPPGSSSPPPTVTPPPQPATVTVPDYTKFPNIVETSPTGGGTFVHNKQGIGGHL